MTLLDVLARLGPKLGIELVAHGVDHGLRPEASRELDLAEAHAKAVDVPFGRSVVAVARGGNLQARARAARYAALTDAASRANATAIATAHHADDRAETVLLRLMRGAGPAGLAVLPPRATGSRPESSGARADADDDVPRGLRTPSIDRVRPLVRARRAALRAYAARHGIAYADDPSNADPRYLRTRVRREVLPLLEELAPGIVGHLVALADQLGERERANEPSEVFPFPLPRATKLALAELARSRSASTRVWLPHGLVVQVAPEARPRAPRRSER